MQRWVRIIAATALIVSATTAFGAVKEGQFSVSPVIGGYTFDGRQDLDTNMVYGIRAGYNFTKRFGIEALFDYVRTNPGNVNTYRYGGELLYHVWPDKVVVPYLAVGVAGISFDGNDSRNRFDGNDRRNMRGYFDSDAGGRSYSNDGNKTRVAFDYGLGAKFFLNDSFALRTDVRNIIYGYNNKTYNNIEYTIGAHFPFGGVTPVAKPVEEVKVVEVPKAAPVEKPVPAKVEAPAPVVAPPTPAAQRFCNKPAILSVEFDTDKVDIKSKYEPDIAKLAEFLKEFPNAKGEISGHTDSVASAAYNMKLSQRRADSVKTHLVKKFGIASDRISTKGYGLSKPIASNKTKEGKAKNRRIEANFTCE